MRKRRDTRLWVALCGLALLGTQVSAVHAKEEAPMHPRFPLLDRSGENVLNSGKPLSPMWTCGSCHDSDYIHSHSFHVCVGFRELAPAGQVHAGRPWDTSPGMFGRWNPLTYRLLTPEGESPLDLGTPEWIKLSGWRHVGGGLSLRARDLRPLADLPFGDPGNPQTSILDPTTGETLPWDWKKSGTVEMNCLLCHMNEPAANERRQALQEGRFAWAATASLARTGLVKPTERGWSWERDAFGEDGEVGAETLKIVQPQSHHCGLCHGLVHKGKEPLSWYPGLKNWSTETKGQVFSGQQMSLSAMNLDGKTGLTRSWDIHAERLLRCSGCHHSLNHPAYRYEIEETRLLHLKFEPRVLDTSEYLKRPSHQFARGESAQGPYAPMLRGTMRRCENCHDYEPDHKWLPYAQRHAKALLCEACHIPKVFASARRQTDWTLLTKDKTPHIEYRGILGDPKNPESLITGFNPMLLPRKMSDGSLRLAPHNVVTSWFWVGGAPPRPVRKFDIERALFEGSEFHPAVVAALDSDKNGRLDSQELRLDAPEKVAAVRQRLEVIGVKNPQIRGEIQPISVHHNVAAGSWSIRDCGACHSADSAVTRPFKLASYVPGGVLPVPVGDTNVQLAGLHAKVFQSDPPPARPTPTLIWALHTPDVGMFILGNDRKPWIDWLGIAVIAMTLLGVLAHGGLRLAVHFSGRKENS